MRDVIAVVTALLLASPCLAAPPADALAGPGVADLLRAAAAQVEAGDLDAARSTLEGIGLLGSAQDGPTVDPERTVQLYGEGDAALQAGDVATARDKWAEALTFAGGDARATEFIGGMLEMTEVVGASAGDLSAVQDVLQGKLPDLSTGTTMVFFFEPWCPHCREELPALQQRLEAFSARGIRLVGLTRLTRGTTARDVKQLIRQGRVAYPVAVESGQIADRFRVAGIPAAALVQNGTIVWRGHPQQLGDAALDRFAAR